MCMCECVFLSVRMCTKESTSLVDEVDNVVVWRPREDLLFSISDWVCALLTKWQLPSVCLSLIDSHCVTAALFRVWCGVGSFVDAVNSKGHEGKLRVCIRVTTNRHTDKQIDPTGRSRLLASPFITRGFYQFVVRWIGRLPIQPNYARKQTASELRVGDLFCCIVQRAGYVDPQLAHNKSSPVKCIVRRAIFKGNGFYQCGLRCCL